MAKFIFLKKNSSLFLALLLSFLSWQNANAVWQDPGTSAPNQNIFAPLNVGSGDQMKSGKLNIGSGLNYWITKDGDSFALKNNALATKLVIGQDGKVGIGTASPAAELHVYGPKGVMAEDADGYGFYSGKKSTNVAQNAYYDSSWKSYGSAAANGSAVVLQTDGIGGNAFSIFADTSISAADESLFFDKLLTVKTAGNVGIGTTSPTVKLEVAGQVKITGGTPGLNKVLTSDATGLATWQTPSSGLTGSGTANYISKFTGASALGNSQIFDNGTNVGIGMTTLGAKLDVNGEVRTTTLNIASGSATGWSDQIRWYDSNKTTINHLFYVNSDSSDQLVLSLNYSGGKSDTLLVSGNVSATAFFYSSDASLKKDITPINNSLDKIAKLNGVYFKWKDSNEPSIGLIAQDVEKVFPAAVSTHPGSGLKSVNYGSLVAPLIEAVKTQQEQISNMENKIEALQTQINALKQ